MQESLIGTLGFKSLSFHTFDNSMIGSQRIDNPILDHMSTFGAPFLKSKNVQDRMNKQINQTQAAFGNYLFQICPKFIDKLTIEKGEMTVHSSPEHLIGLMSILRDHGNCQFKSLIDITAVDFPERKANTGRFEVVYHLLTLHFRSRIRVKVYVDELDNVPSISGLYSGANWYEREVWDLFGIFFSNHPDLRRILTDYGFEGYPLRKDFPLTGYVEVRYDDEEKRVVCEPLELTQKYRSFQFLSPWAQIGSSSTQRNFTTPQPSKN